MSFNLTDTRPAEKQTLVGFSCGHVFHLSCLLEASEEADRADIETLQRKAPLEDAIPSRSVKAKVEHAHEIKRAAGGGCPICAHEEGMD